MKLSRILILAGLLACMPAAAGDQFAALCADRKAIEQVYHNHRTGDKGSAEEVLSKSLIEKLVREDLKKEAALKKFYGIEISPPQIEAEVKRINSTSRAPEILQELKQALGNDAARFARAVAKPLVVDRELRSRYANDDKLHLSRRKQAELARKEIIDAKKTNAPLDRLITLLKTNKAGAFNEVTWRLGSKTNPNEVEAGTQNFSFDDLSPQLREVLRAQLRSPGDISAVIETPEAFLLFLAKDKTAEALDAAVFSLPKQPFDEWLQSLSGL
jgi:hypothetical protein